MAVDLEECSRQYSQKKHINLFNLARRDISLKFHIPQMLIGREQELQILMETFERVGEGDKEIMLVAGHPGIGKSALIQEIHKPILAQRGYFLSGKYDQFRRDVPYSSLIQAFLGLVRQILSESEERIAKWKAALIKALGSNGKVITDVIPDVSHIIGPTADVPLLGPEEAQNRFNFVFKNFVKVFATEDHPIVLFLDDVQWADSSSIRLVNALMSDYGLEYFLLIASFRDNEVDSSHPFMTAIDSLREKAVPVQELTLAPLTAEHVASLISYFLRCSLDECRELANLIHHKTGGNPFFVNQFLKSLYEEGLLQVRPQTGWEWDIDAIAKQQVTQNVVELLAQKISKLPQDTQDLLKACACIGNRFDLETLTIVTDSSIEDTLDRLTTAIDEGLIHRTGELYYFHHDRILEAAYLLIPEENKSQMHYTIGRYMLDNTDELSLPKKVLYIVNQLNAGRDRLTTREEKNRLRELNILSAEKARRSTAYGSAYTYLKVALEYVDHQTWQNDRANTLDLYINAAEAAYLSANFDDMERLSAECLRHAKTPLEIVKVQNVRINTYIAQHKMREAIDTGLHVLEILGTKTTKKPKKWQAAVALLRAKQSYRGRAIETLADLPFFDDPIVNAKMEMYATMGSLRPDRLSPVKSKPIGSSKKSFKCPSRMPVPKRLPNDGKARRKRFIHRSRRVR